MRTVLASSKVRVVAKEVFAEQTMMGIASLVSENGRRERVCSVRSKRWLYCQGRGERGEGPSAMGRQVRVCVCVTDMVCCKGDSR